MRALMLILGFCIATAAFAQESTRQFAALSLVGDGFTIVFHRIETGSHIDRNERQFVDLGDPVLDNTVLESVERTVRSVRPGTKVVLLGARDPALFAAQQRSLDEAGGSSSIVAQVRAAALAAGATHLILVTKLRHDAMLRLGSSHTGSGKLQGLGFYLDFAKQTRRADTGERGQGFLAPYAYFKVSIVDLASGRVDGERDVVASMTRSTSRGETTHPWDAMTAEQKVGALRALIRREIARVMPELLGAS